jgi:cell fate regulator YaaT (PSP1 superfamily)
MCCLKYEQEAYEYLQKTVPKADMTVDTPQGKGTVTEVNFFAEE